MLGSWMESEIREQPRLLEENSLRYYNELSSFLSGKQFEMILLVARGSSDNAAQYARYLFEIQLGIPVNLVAPSVLTKYSRHVQYRNCLAIGISQSGAAPDVSEVLQSVKQHGHTTLAITNTPESRITKVADFSLFLNSGDEKSVAATKTYTSSLLALLHVARALGATLNFDQNDLPTESDLEIAWESANAVCGTVVRSNPVFSLARGYGFATSLETALKLMECALVPCKSYSSADFEHGPKALAGHGSALISYDGPKPALAEYGCAVIEAPDFKKPEYMAPISDILFGQCLALAVARARGLNPDNPRHIQKVTETL